MAAPDPTTRAEGAPQLSVSRELAILALANPGDTPRRRAERHGLDVQQYLYEVYGREPAPLATHRPRPPAPPNLALEAREARARRVLAALAETPDASDTVIARRVGCGRGVVYHIRHGRSWAHLREATPAPLTLRAALERRRAG